MTYLRRVVLYAVLAGALAVALSGAASEVARSPGGALELRRSGAPMCPAWRRSRSWSAARVLSRRGRQFRGATLAVAPSGEAIAAWGPGVTVSLRRAGGRF